MRNSYWQLILLLLLSAPSLCAAQTTPLTGTVVDVKDSTAISNVNIINLSTKRGTATDPLGRFIISAAEGDYLRLSAIGYDTLYYAVADAAFFNEEFIIYFVPRTYSIPEVTVSPFGTYQQFKQSFMNLKLEDNITLNLPELPPAPMVSFQGGGIGVTGALGMLHEKWSKQGKERTVYRQLVKEKDQSEYIATRYNSSIVKRITGMVDEEDIKLFMKFCHLQYEFVSQSTDYQLYAAVKECYKEYLRRN